MKLGEAILGVALVAILGSGAVAATFDFDSLPVGTVFGSDAGHGVGEVVHSEDGIDMSVENFFFVDFIGFFHAEVGGQHAEFFPTTPLELNNINVRFDFTNVGFAVNSVTMEFMEFGGENNFGVNGSPVYELMTLAEMPANPAPGVSATVAPGFISLSGNIQLLEIGGQELVIDTVFAIPEPATSLLLGLVGVLVSLSRLVPVQPRVRDTR